MQLTIALVGMPGSGKSTVGRQLARQLGRRFIDSDAEIEREIGGPIRAFFEQQGEPAFRDLEQRVLSRLALQPGTVLATGGGSVLREANRRDLAAHCVVLYLRSTPEELFRRLRHDTHRPLLQVPDPLKRLRELFRERDPLYRDVARYTIETGRPSVATLVNMVMMQLELAGLVSSPPPPGLAPAEPSAGPAPEVPGAPAAG